VTARQARRPSRARGLLRRTPVHILACLVAASLFSACAPFTTADESAMASGPVTPVPVDVEGVPAVDACAHGCTLSFASGPDWPSFAGGADVGGVRGPSVGPARPVCVSLQVPDNCPAATNGTLIYGYGQGGWAAGAAFPRALWVWRGDVEREARADLQVAIFERTFTVGARPTGSIQIGADDYASVFVNDVPVGAIGSVADVHLAGRAQNASTTFDLTRALRPGRNTITVVAQNGPSSYAGGCGGQPCTYAQNPAGVVFAGTLSWR
jgi:hypothetical protein